VDEGRPLADERDAQAPRAPPPDNVVDGADEPLGAVLDPLRDEGVRLVDGQMEGLPVLAVESRS
jgi:hypothetical protein